MILQRTVRHHHFHSPSLYFKNLHKPTSNFSDCNHFSFLASIFSRPFSLSSHIEHKESGNRQQKSEKARRRLSVYFKQAVGIPGEITNSDSEIESDTETAELKKRLTKLEEQVRGFNEEKPRDNPETNTLPNEVSSKNEVKSSLYALFANDGVKKNDKFAEMNAYGVEDPSVYKKLSPDMESFVYHLYKDGYFRDSNFLPRNKFDLTCFENSYAREFIKHAAVSFGKDNQEIAKWLSAGDLKTVALFGCPSLGNKSVSAAKRLRAFFHIQENTVCQKCPLKMSCKHANKVNLKGDAKNLNLADVMKVIVMYAMESVPPELTVSNEIQKSVGRILKEVVRLSQLPCVMSKDLLFASTFQGMRPN